MSDDRLRDPSAAAGSPRLTALALVIAAAATAGIALHPGLALADGAGPSSAAAAHRSADASRIAVRPSADDDQATDDDPAADDAGSATDGQDLDLGTDDDGAGAADDAGTDDDGPVDDAAADAADDPIPAVAIDRRGRALAGPRSFAAGRTARASKLRWTGWNAASTVGRGRIKVRSAGHGHRTLRGTGTITLSRLTRCDDGTPVYRRAVLAVGRKGAVTVKLPGCSALR